MPKAASLKKAMPVGMCHGAKPAQHSRHHRATLAQHLARHRAGGNVSSCQHAHKVEDILKRERLVHRAQFEVAAVRKDLLGDLATQDRAARLQQARSLGSVKEHAREYQRLGVREKVVALQVPLQSAHQPARLNGEALAARFGQGLSAKRSLDPIHDAQRGGVWLPSGPCTWRIRCHPICQQCGMPRHAVGGALRAQVVEIVLVIAPELFTRGAIPADLVERSGLAEE